MSMDTTTSGDGRGYMTEERILIRDTAREFTLKEVLPVANELDPVQGEIPEGLRGTYLRNGPNPAFQPGPTTTCGTATG